MVLMLDYGCLLAAGRTLLLTCTAPSFHVQEGSTGPLQGPYLHCAGVAPWHAYLVAHRKAVDEHIMLLQLPGSPGGASQVVMVTDDQTRVALPSCPNGDENYVLGLAIDTSCNAVGFELQEGVLLQLVCVAGGALMQLDCAAGASTQSL